MDARLYHVRAHRLLCVLALAYLAAVIVLWLITPSSNWFFRFRFGLTTLGLLWPLILLLHPGRSARRLTAFGLSTVILLVPCLVALNTLGVFGLPFTVHANPRSIWEYVRAYQAGRSAARKEVAAGILAIEVTASERAAVTSSRLFEIATRSRPDRLQDA